MWKRNEVSFPFLFDHVEKTKRNEQIRSERKAPVRAREGNLSEDNSSSWYSSSFLLPRPMLSPNSKTFKQSLAEFDSRAWEESFRASVNRGKFRSTRAICFIERNIRPISGHFVSIYNNDSRIGAGASFQLMSLSPLFLFFSIIIDTIVSSSAQIRITITKRYNHYG